MLGHEFEEPDLARPDPHVRREIETYAERRHAGILPAIARRATTFSAAAPPGTGTGAAGGGEISL